MYHLSGYTPFLDSSSATVYTAVVLNVLYTNIECLVCVYYFMHAVQGFQLYDVCYKIVAALVLGSKTIKLCMNQLMVATFSQLFLSP